MKTFKTLTGTAVPLMMNNVDTDMIIPKQFLKTIKRSGLGKNLFDEMRYNADGSEIPAFVLNQAPYRKSSILISGDNFGCGSSREHAPWAILDFGIYCIITKSFADIFYNNCFKNGILPIALPEEQVEELADLSSKDPEVEITIDLQSQKITAGSKVYEFDVDSFRKHCLLNGLDDIGLTLEKTEAIDNFEKTQKEKLPWLYGNTV